MNLACHESEILLRHAEGMFSRAAVFHGGGRAFSIESMPVPSLQAGELLVRVDCATVCTSDLHTVTGRRTAPLPLVLGHEMVGRIVGMGEGAQFQPGQRVVWSILLNCGSCFFCARDLPSACGQLRKFGHDREALMGGFAEHCRLPAGTRVFPVPARIPDELASVAVCAGATAAAVLRQAALQPGETIVIYGAGMLGLITCAMAVAQGLRVVVSEPDPGRLRLAHRLGAASKDVVPGRGCDAVLELAGSPAAAEQGLDRLRPGGRLVLAGSVFPDKPLALPAETIVKRRLQISGVYNYAPDDLAAALAFFARPSARGAFAPLVEGRFRLEEVNEAFAFALVQRPLRTAIYPEEWSS